MRTLYSYKGNYSYYLEKRDARIENEATETGKQATFQKELGGCAPTQSANTKSKSRIVISRNKGRASKRRNDHQVQLELNMGRMGTGCGTTQNFKIVW